MLTRHPRTMTGCPVLRAAFWRVGWELAPGALRAFAFICIAVLVLFFTACNDERKMRFAEGTELSGGGNPQAGIADIRKYGCGGCHTISGIEEARGLVGPPLDKFAYRAYIAGKLPNTPDNLMHWIQKPQDVVPSNAMPDMGVTEQESRDIAAYLYTLR